MGRALTRALTLIEVLLAGFIATIAIISLAMLFIRGLQVQRKSASMLQAAQVAQQQLEQLRALPAAAHPAPASFRFDGRVPDARVGAYPPSPYPEVELDGKRYQVLIQFSPGPDGLRRARVEVFSPQTRFAAETLLAP